MRGDIKSGNLKQKQKKVDDQRKKLYYGNVEIWNPLDTNVKLDKIDMFTYIFFIICELDN